MRRASIGLHWILIGIVGAIIIIFFYSIASKQAKLNEREIEIGVSSRIATVLREAQGEGETYKETNIPLLATKELEARCIDEKLYIDLGGSRVNIPGAIPFIPRRVGGGNVLIITNSLEVPFNIGIGVTMIDKNTRIIDGYGLGFPEEITSESCEKGVRCICVNRREKDCDEHIEIDNSEKLIKINGKEYEYLGDGMLKLAVIAGDNYNCSLALIQERAAIIASILQERVEKIMDNLDCNNPSYNYDCCLLLSLANQSYAAIVGNNGNIKILKNEYSTLKNIQRDAYIKNCPDIY